MKQIEIDDEVFGYLQSKAIPFVETPNLTLRRLFQIDKLPEKINPLNQPTQNQGQRKQKKTDLSLLIQAGLLQEGQTLYLYDYRGNKIDGFDVILSGKSIIWNGQAYSMSYLAQKFLKQKGYGSNSVRGPEHWYNSDSISIKGLWQQYLKNRQR
ncbi:MAG: hypothetical protein FD151_1377 [bacterium]|nr:MAG: hypothetical protein FD151_1377 [bacterium]